MASNLIRPWSGTVRNYQFWRRAIIKRAVIKIVLGLSVLILSSFSTSAAHAACTDPVAVAGALRYNSSVSTMQYCDDTNWVMIGTTPRLAGPGLPVDPSLVGWWKLDEITFVSAADSSASGNDGSLQNGVGFGASGVLGYAYDFDKPSLHHVNVGDVPELKITGAMTLSVWLNARSTQNSTILGKIDYNANTRSYRLETDPITNNRYKLSIYSTCSDAGTFVSVPAGFVPLNEWHNITATYAPSNRMRIFVDGILISENTTSIPAAIADCASPVMIGARLNSGIVVEGWDGLLDDARVYNRELTPAEIAQCCSKSYIYQNDALSNGLVGHWKLDETSGTDVIDYASSNNGTMVGGLTGADSVDGKLNKALTFDGVDDYIRMPTNDPFDSLQAGTVTAWFKATDLSADNVIFLYSTIGNDNSVARWQIDPPGDNNVLRFRWKAPNAGWNSVVGTTPIQTGRWYHAAFVSDGASRTKIYLNGIEENTFFDLIQTGDGSEEDFIADIRDIGTFNHFPQIGAYSRQSGDDYFFNGDIDDVRIYNRALTSEEVKNIYDAWEGHLVYEQEARVPKYFNGEQWVPAGTVRPAGTGLVGHWKLDDTSGTFADSSGYGNDGTQAGGVEYASTGIIGNAAGFDGTDDVISVPSDSSIEDFKALTLAAWVKPSISNGGNGRRVIYKDGDEYQILLGGADQLQMRLQTSAGSFTFQGTSSNGPNTGWHHFAGTWDGATAKVYVDGAFENENAVGGVLLNDSLPLYIGAIEVVDATRAFGGIIDDVRIYNQALSTADIYDLYVTSPYAIDIETGLVGHWRLDELGNTTTAVDSAGSNNGTLTNFPADTSANWINGHNVGALDFDGTDDYVNVGIVPALEITGALTVAAWIYPREIPSVGNQGQTMVSMWDLNWPAGPCEGWNFGPGWEYDAFEFIVCDGVSAAGPGNDIQLLGFVAEHINSWVHVAGTYSPSSFMRLYVNGDLTASETTGVAASIGYNADPLNFGRRSETGSHFNGTLDDIRIYNRTLSNAEIKALYNNTGVCSNPEKYGGSIVYNQSFNIMQYCDGVNWNAIGK
jgi:hypothetical protein